MFQKEKTEYEGLSIRVGAFLSFMFIPIALTPRRISDTW